MTARYLRTIAIGVLCLLGLPAYAQSTKPDAPTSIGLHSVTIGDRGTELLLRFDRPINHVTSWLSLVRDGQIIETVHFRLETAPNVLFARISDSGARQLHCALDGVPGRQQRQTRGRIAVHGRPGIQYR